MCLYVTGCFPTPPENLKTSEWLVQEGIASGAAVRLDELGAEDCPTPEDGAAFVTMVLAHREHIMTALFGSKQHGYSGMEAIDDICIPRSGQGANTQMPSYTFSDINGSLAHYYSNHPSQKPYISAADSNHTSRRAILQSHAGPQPLLRDTRTNAGPARSNVSLGKRLAPDDEPS